MPATTQWQIATGIAILVAMGALLALGIVWSKLGPCKEYLLASLGPSHKRQPLLLITTGDGRAFFSRVLEKDGKYRQIFGGHLHEWLQFKTGGLRFGDVQLQVADLNYGLLTDPDIATAIEEIKIVYDIHSLYQLKQCLRPYYDEGGVRMENCAPNGMPISADDPILIPLIKTMNLGAVAHWSGMTPSSRGESMESILTQRELNKKLMKEGTQGHGMTIALVGILMVFCIVGLSFMMQ